MRRYLDDNVLAILVDKKPPRSLCSGATFQDYLKLNAVEFSSGEHDLVKDAIFELLTARVILNMRCMLSCLF